MLVQFIDLVAEPVEKLFLKDQRSKKESKEAHVYYLSGARNHFFKLEAACRYLREIDNTKFFKQYYSIFKAAEDQLGQYDHYLSLLTDVKKFVKKWPLKVIEYFEDVYLESSNQLETFLLTEEWLQAQPPHLTRFRKELLAMEPLTAETYKKRFGNFLMDTLKKLSGDYEKGKLDASEIETGIHETRRKIRWISIYTQVCGGIIQLKDTPSTGSLPEYYKNPEILHSDFLKMPVLKKGMAPILLSKENFAALSWMINFLGNLKDIGLKATAYTTAFERTGITDKQEISRYLKLILPVGTSPDDIPNEARKQLDLFFSKYKIPECLSADIKQSLR